MGVLWGRLATFVGRDGQRWTLASAGEARPGEDDSPADPEGASDRLAGWCDDAGVWPAMLSLYEGILPGNSAAEEIGALMNGDAMLAALSEIAAYMFRRKGIFRSPGVGRTALGAFSSGNNLVTSFLAANQRRPFCTSTLKEVYMFDAPMGLGPSRGTGMNRWVREVLAWLASGPSAEKRARAYVQEATDSLRATVGGRVRAPGVGESADGRITVSILPHVSRDPCPLRSRNQ